LHSFKDPNRKRKGTLVAFSITNSCLQKKPNLHVEKPAGIKPGSLLNRNGDNEERIEESVRFILFSLKTCLANRVLSRF
jgi:hypothetical protein